MMDYHDVINLEKEGTRPRDLIRIFREEREIPNAGMIVKKDIPIERIPCRTDVSPLDFNILSTDGKLTIDRNSIVRYLKAKRIVFIGSVPFIFNGCAYIKSDASDVARLIYEAVDAYGTGTFVTKTMVSDIIAKLQVTSLPWDIPTPEGWNDDGLYDENELIPFDNGLYNYVHDEFLRFTPCVFMTYQLGATYNPRITEHPVESVYRKIIPNDGTRKFFFEMVGYSLFSVRMFPPAIFVIYGPGRTGKTALHEAVKALAGSNNISSLDLTQLSGEFTTVELLGKLINICGETGSKQTRYESHVDGELLKRLSDGQAITVQQKFKSPFEFRNSAKLWFITNTIPDFGDDSSGIYRRVYIIPCRNEQDDSERIYEKLTEPSAVSWLANKALQGYRDFLNNNCQFHTSPEMQSEVRAYKKQEPFMDFLESAYGTTNKMLISDKLDGKFVREIYQDYCDYCSQGGGKAMSQRKMTEKIRNEYSLNTVTVFTHNEQGKGTYWVKFEKPKSV